MGILLIYKMCNILHSTFHILYCAETVHTGHTFQLKDMCMWTNGKSIPSRQNETPLTLFCVKLFLWKMGQCVKHSERRPEKQMRSVWIFLNRHQQQTLNTFFCPPQQNKQKPMRHRAPISGMRDRLERMGEQESVEVRVSERLLERWPEWEETWWRTLGSRPRLNVPAVCVFGQ